MDIERQVTAVLRARMSREKANAAATADGAVGLQILSISQASLGALNTSLAIPQISACDVHDADGRFSLSIERDDAGKFRVNTAIYLGRSVSIEVAPDADLHRLVGRAAVSLQFGASS